MPVRNYVRNWRENSSPKPPTNCSERQGSRLAFASADESGVGSLIHWALKESVSGREPSPQVWRNVLSEIQNKKRGAQSRQRGRFSVSFVPLLEAVVLSALILAFGISLEQDFDLWQQGAPSVVATPTRETVASAVLFESRDDMLNGAFLARTGREQDNMGLHLPPFREVPW